MIASLLINGRRREFMNKLIHYALFHNLITVIYYGTMIAGLVGELISATILSKKYGEKPWKALVTWLIGVPALYYWMKVQFWIESGFKTFGGYNIVRTYIWFPVVAWLFSRLLKADPKKMCDSFGPSCVIIQAIAHWGCAFMGCCYGYPYENGIYNVALRDYRFPIQIVEAVVSLLIVVLLLNRTRLKGFVSDGTQFPWMLILFGGTRFFLEFLRDNEKIFLGISNLAIHSLIMVVAGIIWLSRIDVGKDKKSLFIKR